MSAKVHVYICIYVCVSTYIYIYGYKCMLAARTDGSLVCGSPVAGGRAAWIRTPCVSTLEGITKTKAQHLKLFHDKP